MAQFNVDVRSNAREIVAGINADVRAIARATRMGLNRTGEQLRTQADREIRAEYNVKLKAIRAQSRLRKAAQSGPLVVDLDYYGAGKVSLLAYGARQTKRGVTVAVRRGGGRKLIPGAFIAKMKSGLTGVFARTTGGKGQRVFRGGPGSRIKPRGSDLPISHLTAVDLPVLYGRKSFSQKQMRYADARFDKNFMDALRVALRS
jgi:hypothetical protein